MIRCDDKSEIPGLIRNVCMTMLGHARQEEVSLLLGTAAVESHLVHRRQFGGGPARGLCQMEPNTARDIFENYLQYRAERFRGLVRTWLDTEEDVQFRVPSYDELERDLEAYDDFAFAMARIHYLRVPDSIPNTISEQAAYWKEFYNTSAGAGTVEKYMEAWEECECEDLLVD
ncbi:hypothetical protein ACFL6S_01795 [Candidatus Poribacteria bacterium]